LISIIFLGRQALALENSDITINAADLQIDQSGNPEPSDRFQLEATFTNTEGSESGTCDGDNPIANGFTITLGTGASCSSTTPVVTVTVPPLTGGSEDMRSSSSSKRSPSSSKRKSHRLFKRELRGKATTDSGSDPAATINGEIRALPTPAGTCAQWSLDLEVSGVDLSAITSNPVETTLGVGDDSGCTAVTAQISNDQDDDNNDQGDDNDDQGDTKGR
jgi:hypothetical protein